MQPGEWRTLGHFAAADDAELEKVLASMPLRVWRTDQVTPLSPHPNDPVPAPPPGPPEFLTTFTLAIPEGTPARTVEDTGNGLLVGGNSVPPVVDLRAQIQIGELEAVDALRVQGELRDAE